MSLRAAFFGTLTATGALVAGAANAQDSSPLTPPSPENIATMSTYDVKRAVSNLGCVTEPVLIPRSELETYTDERQASITALQERFTQIDDIAFNRAFSIDLPRYLESFESDPNFADTGFEPEFLAQVAAVMQHSLLMEYPQATCGVSYNIMGPFNATKEALNESFNENFGLMNEEGLATSEFIDSAEADGTITSNEALGLMQHRIAAGFDTISNYQSPALNGVAESMLQAIGVEPTQGNVYALSRQLLLAGTTQQEYNKHVEENGDPLDAFKGITTKDLFDAMRNNMLGFGDDHDNIDGETPHHHLEDGTAVPGHPEGFEDENIEAAPPLPDGMK